MGIRGPVSPNFACLAKHHPLLERYAAKAERTVFDDPNDALNRHRQFGEILAQLTCGHLGVELPPAPEFASVLRALADRRVANRETLDLFHGLRRSGNADVHQHADDPEGHRRRDVAARGLIHLQSELALR